MACALTCEENLKLRACGGFADYNWTIMGPGVLVRKKGEFNQVRCMTDAEASASGTNPEDDVVVTVQDQYGQQNIINLGDVCNCCETEIPGIAYVRPRSHFRYELCSSCGPPPVDGGFFHLEGGFSATLFDCCGNEVTDVPAVADLDWIGSSPYANLLLTITHEGASCENVNEVLEFPGGPSGLFKTGCCNSIGTVLFTLDVTQAGATIKQRAGPGTTVPAIVHAAAVAFSGSTMLAQTACTNMPAFQPYMNGIIDIRTQAMIDNGCQLIQKF